MGQYDYCDVPMVKSELANQGATVYDEQAIVERIPRVTQLINAHCQHSFHSETITNEIRASVRGQAHLHPDGFLLFTVKKGAIQSISSISVSNDLLTYYEITGTSFSSLLIDRYEVMVPNLTVGLERNYPLFVKVSYLGGFSSTDPKLYLLQNAACRWTAFSYMKRKSPFDIIAYPSMGQINVPGTVPDDVLSTLNSLKRVRP